MRENLWIPLKTQAETNGEKVFLVQGDTQLTYAEFAKRASAYSNYLLELGVKKGDRVVVAVAKSTFEVLSLYAIWKLGAIAVIIGNKISVRQLKHILSDAEPKVLVVDSRLRSQLDGEKVKTIGPEDFKDISETNMIANFDGPIDVDISNLIYTSGSTGLPKGVVLTHNNCIRGGEIVSTYLGLRKEDRLASILPLSFDYGMNQILSAVTVGASVVIVSSTLAGDIVRDLSKSGATVLAMVPLLWAQVATCLDESSMKLEKIRLITNSGGMVPRGLLQSVERPFPNAEVVLMYGLTEAFRATYLPPKLFKEKLGSIGRSIPNNQIFVINSEGECGPDEVGELVQRGCLLSKGYWKNEAATNEKFKTCPQLKDKIGNEVVLYSGDYVKKDKDGIIWFVGRRDSMIKHSGYRISPEEIEGICTKFPGVIAAAAFNTLSKTEESVLVVELQVKASSNFSKDDFLRFCSKEMPAYMVPNITNFRIEDFPKTSSGKMDRQKIKHDFKLE